MSVTERDGRTFDWTARFDPRSLGYRAAAAVTAMPARGRIWTHGPVLDQGQEGACVGFGSSGAVAAEPAGHPGVTDTYARNWYKRAQRLDAWAGENYEGTSVLAGCLVGRERKLWTGFRWAKSPAELAAGIITDTLGPAIIGVRWAPEFYDSGPVLDPDARLDPQLGHCVLVFGYMPQPGRGRTRALFGQLEELDLAAAVDTVAEPCFLILNSWSSAWAEQGCAVAPASLVRRWVAARGEFAMPENRTVERTAAAMAEPDQQQPETVQSVTLHLTAVEVQDGDRILDPPDDLRQESVTVRGAPRQVVSWRGRRVVIDSTAGVFQYGAADPVTVRRQG